MLSVLYGGCLVFEVVEPEAAIEPRWLCWVYLRSEKSRLFLNDLLVVIQLKKLLICIDHHAHVSKIVHLLLLVMDALFSDVVVCLLDLCMDIVAGDKHEL